MHSTARRVAMPTRVILALLAAATMTLLTLISLNLLRPRDLIESSKTGGIAQNDDHTPLRISAARRGSGFSLVAGIDSLAIIPDIDKQLEFRTSQLVVFHGKSWPSRKVLYTSIIAHGPSIVVVLPLDAYGNLEMLRAILHERKLYCKLHNYGLFVRYIQDFAAQGRPALESLGLAPLRMLRQAMLAFPQAEWFWLLSPEGHIRDLNVPLLVEDLQSLETVLEKDLDTAAVSITHFTQIPEQADVLVTSEPITGIVSARSLTVRRSLASQVLLDLISDPLLQNWAPFFQSGDHAGTALTHIIRWHPALLKSIGLLSPRLGGTNKCADTLPDSICMIGAEE